MKKIEQQDLLIHKLITRGTPDGQAYELKEQESKHYTHTIHHKLERRVLFLNTQPTYQEIGNDNFMCTL